MWYTGVRTRDVSDLSKTKQARYVVRLMFHSWDNRALMMAKDKDEARVVRLLFLRENTGVGSLGEGLVVEVFLVDERFCIQSLTPYRAHAHECY